MRYNKKHPHKKMTHCMGCGKPTLMAFCDGCAPPPQFVRYDLWDRQALIDGHIMTVPLVLKRFDS